MRIVILALLLFILGCTKNETSPKINIDKKKKDSILSVIKEVDSIDIDTPKDTIKNEIDNYDDVPQTINKKLLTKMITHFFSLEPTCIFQSKFNNNNTEIEPITLFNSKYYSYSTGPIQLVDGHHNRCDGFLINGLNYIAGWSNDSTKELSSDNSHLSIELLSGINPNTIEELPEGRSFCRINPKIVRWGVKNLIPDPKLKIGDLTMQQIYNTMFSSLFRNLYNSLMWLEKEEGRIERDYKEYRDSVSIKYKRFNTVLFLRKKYKNVKFDNIGESLEFNEPEAIGFWLRRYWDGSLPELKKGLIKLLEIYDPKTIYGYEKYDYSKISKVVTEDSLKGLVIYYPGLTVNFPNINFTCDNNPDSIAGIDTFNIEWSDAFGCGYGEFDTINLFKSKNIQHADLYHQGTKAYFFNDDGSGGVWTDTRIEIISSEVADIYSQTDTAYIVDDIFNLEYKWKKEFSYEHSEIAEKIKAEQEYRTSMILPHSYNFVINWSVKNDDNEDYKNFKKVIRIEFVHGD